MLNFNFLTDMHFPVIKTLNFKILLNHCEIFNFGGKIRKFFWETMPWGVFRNIEEDVFLRSILKDEGGVWYYVGLAFYWFLLDSLIPLDLSSYGLESRKKYTLKLLLMFPGRRGRAVGKFFLIGERGCKWVASGMGLSGETDG